MTPLQSAMVFTGRAEGGFVDDSGGPTMDGVTQRTYDGFRSSHGLAKQSVRLITVPERDAIMHDMYWVPAHCDELPDKVAIAHFDAAFNMSPEEAIKILQRALGDVIDGDFGPATLKSVQTADPVALLEDYLDARETVYRLIAVAKPDEAKYLEGWLNRVAALRVYLARLVA